MRINSTRELSVYTFLKLGSALLFLVMVAWGAFGHRSERTSADEGAREAFLEACLRERGQSACDRRLEEDHEVCFRGNYRQGGRWTGTSFGQALYLQCMEQGSSAFFLERRREKARREGMGLPE